MGQGANCQKGNEENRWDITDKKFKYKYKYTPLVEVNQSNHQFINKIVILSIKISVTRCFD